MGYGFGWKARWPSPFTGQLSGLMRGGFASGAAARDDALNHAPRSAVISIHAPDGRVVDAIPSRAPVPPPPAGSQLSPGRRFTIRILTS